MHTSLYASFPLQIPKGGILQMSSLGIPEVVEILFPKGWWVIRSQRRKYVSIIFANLNMSPLCSVLAHMHVSYKKHVIIVSSVTSPESCTLPGRSGVHKKITLSMCFQHLNPERYICFPRNCLFGESRLGFHFQKGSCN